MKKIMRSVLYTSVISLVLSSHVYAFPISNITNFSGVYSDPTGTASADSFQYENYNFPDSTEFHVEKQAGSLFFQAGDEEFQLDDLPQFVDELTNLNWDNVNLNSDGNLFKFSLGNLSGESENGSVKVRNLKIECTKGSDNDDLVQKVLESCFSTGGKLRLGLIDSYSNEKKKSTKVSSLYLSAKGEKLYFSVKQGVKVKGYGKVYYENNVLRLKVTKVKAGFLNVTNKFFKEIRKAESDNIKIDRPWIEISLDNL